ncbi:MAG: AAA family ATPase [Gammaproteobacteria bacterium]
MQKDTISIQILGSSKAKCMQYRNQISTLINREITTLIYDTPSTGPLYKDKDYPNILILLLDDITIEALNQLSALPSAIRPALLVIASEHNQHQMRLAMQAGARDFFNEPVDKEELHKSLNKIIFDLRRGRSQQGTLTTVINAKGGSGGSFITCNLAHIAAVASNSSCVLVDFDLQFGSQSLNLDLKPVQTLVDAIQEVRKLDFDALDGYMSQHKSGLRLLTTIHDHLVLPGEIDVENLDQLLTLLIGSYQRIFIDLPRQIDNLSATILERSSQIIIVVQQSLAHMRDAKRLMSLLKSELNISGKNIIIVVNRHNPEASLQLNDIQTYLECSEIYTIPNDFEKVAQSMNLGIPLYDYARNCAISKSMMSLVESLNVDIRDEFKEKSFFKKIFRLKAKA